MAASDEAVAAALTAVAVGIGAGAVVTDVVTTAWPFVVLGVGFGLFGVMLIAYGVVRHREVERALDRGADAPLDPRAAVALAAFGVALGLISVLAVLIET